MTRHLAEYTVEELLEVTVTLYNHLLQIEREKQNTLQSINVVTGQVAKLSLTNLQINKLSLEHSLMEIEKTYKQLNPVEEGFAYGK